jgi:hypothetical protein
MSEDSKSEDHRRRDPAPAVGIERDPRTHRDHLDTGDVRLAASLPLSERQVRDVMSGGRKSLGEVAIPPFGSADRVRAEAVIDKADTHGRGEAVEEYVERRLVDVSDAVLLANCLHCCSLGCS